MEILEIIGFDLGHGETAVAKAFADSNEPPKMLNVHGKNVQITALGKHPDLGYLVGEQALIQAGTTQLQIAFKQRPSIDLDYQSTLQNFFKTYYQILTQTKQINGNSNSYFYVGCPSGWSVQEREDYRKLLQQAGITLVNVIPESRAAFMQAKEDGSLTINKLKSAVLIVDIGSSTTDFTLVKSLSEVPIDFGSNTLGASLIDRLILKKTLENHDQKELLERVFSQYSHHRVRCELACRKVKEEYFSNEQIYLTSKSFAKGFESITDQIYFLPQVNQSMMEELLNQPLLTLDGKSWLQAFHDAVQEAKAKLDQQGIIPEIVLMTGGASRMQFTRKICDEIFSHSATQVRPDPEPERCIALGLARVGRWDLRAAAFREEVNNLLNSGFLKQLIKQQIPDLIQALTNSLSTGLLENAVQAGLKDWQNNQIRTLSDLETSLKLKAETWLKREETQRLLNQTSINWFNQNIQPALAEKTDPICRKFHIPRSSLRFEEGFGSTAINPELQIGDAILSEIVAFTINILIGGGTVASIITLVLTGHIIWPIALVYGASILAAGVELNRNSVKDVIKTNLDVPSWMRGSFLNDSKIDSICKKIEPELKKVVKEQLAADQQAFEQLITKIEQGLKEALNTKVAEAIILIQ
jgi:molecular chaperone DnaK (HSP70)